MGQTSLLAVKRKGSGEERGDPFGSVKFGRESRRRRHSSSQLM